MSSSLCTLKGFQRGRCFSCEDVLLDAPCAAHTDHVFAWFLMNRYEARDAALDGSWNCVAASAPCSLRKSNRLTSPDVLQALVVRNDTVLASSVPLKVVRSTHAHFPA
ncbi:hypothetical protein [Kineococcus sp. SYSU DK002]|uniref:hypothetical protein n=1 Tax=Kineococcus sp. SYSU DK002 TaxID=3383123 RepID=UPI003D7EE62F